MLSTLVAIEWVTAHIYPHVFNRSEVNKFLFYKLHWQNSNQSHSCFLLLSQEAARSPSPFLIIQHDHFTLPQVMYNSRKVHDWSSHLVRFVVKFHTRSCLPWNICHNINNNLWTFFLSQFHLPVSFTCNKLVIFSTKYRCDLANNNGEGQEWSTMSVRNSDVYAASYEIQVFHSLLYLHHSNNLFENISIFLFPPTQLSNLKKIIFR